MTPTLFRAKTRGPGRPARLVPTPEQRNCLAHCLRAAGVTRGMTVNHAAVWAGCRNAEGMFPRGFFESTSKGWMTKEAARLVENVIETL